MKRVRGVESATGQVTDLCIYSFYLQRFEALILQKCWSNLTEWVT